MSLIWEEGVKQPFLELTLDYQTTTNLDWKWLSYRGRHRWSTEALQGRKKEKGFGGALTLPARDSSLGSCCALPQSSWAACRQHCSPKYTKCDRTTCTVPGPARSRVMGRSPALLFWQAHSACPRHTLTSLLYCTARVWEVPLYRAQTVIFIFQTLSKYDLCNLPASWCNLPASHLLFCTVRSRHKV